MFELLQETFTDEDGISTRCFSLVDRGRQLKIPYLCTDRCRAEILQERLNSEALPPFQLQNLIEDYIQSLYM